MNDIKSVWIINRGASGWVVENSDLATGDNISTALLISLFSDMQARDDDQYDGDDRRGWWGDLDSDYRIGSRLWLLTRRKLTKSVADDAVTYIREAVQWMIDDNVIDRIEITYKLKPLQSLYITNVLFLPDGSREEIGFDWKWEVNNAV